MARVHCVVRRPGARDSTDYDCYLKSLFPDADLYALRMLRARCEGVEFLHTNLEKRMLESASRIAAGLDHPGNCRKWSHWNGGGLGAGGGEDWYQDLRKDVMLSWISKDPSRWKRLRDEWTPGAFPPWVERQFEKEAWRYDKGHKRVLAARRRLMRVILRHHLRRAVMTRAIALYWQEQTQRALCAPGGAGRAADTVAFASEFA